jgi:hypothetical protein
VPILVAPPPRFSITVCWPQISESLPATTRAIASVPPPGGNGTISRTNRFGQFEADDVGPNEVWPSVRRLEMEAKAAAASAIARRRPIIR